MKKYTDMSLQERQAEYAAVQAEYEKLKAMGLSLNMARGKPGKAQLDLVTPIFSLLTKPEDFVSDGIETRNYGEVADIPAARGCLRTFWAASRSRCSWAATPACS